MLILLTGGAGYVGSHCLRGLIAAGYDAVVLDNLSRGHRRAVDSRATLVVGEVGDAALLDSLFTQHRFDGVMHFAAFAEVNESVKDPLRYYQNNVTQTVTLLDAMRRHEVRRLVFSSTCAVYGVPPRVPITEDMPKNPINPYGRTKLAIEWALADSATAWGLGATALRYFNAAGASADATIGEHHEPESHLIPLVLQVALGQATSIKVFGEDYPTHDGTCVRDYIHVEDLSHIHVKAIEQQPPGLFQGFNVGTGVGVSVKELIAAARQVTGHPIPAIPAPRREGDPPALYADPTRAQTAFRWKPRFPDIRHTLETAWNWHRTHPRGFEGSAG